MIETVQASTQPDAWLALAVGGVRQHGGNDGYEDHPEVSYSWDNTVPNHGRIKRGDVLVLWDKTALLGASIVERVDVSASKKSIYKCPDCERSGIKKRIKKRPL